MLRRFALLLLLLAGCARVPDPPAPPGPVADTEMDRYFHEFRTQVGIALGKTADAIPDDEAGYRAVYGKNLQAAAMAAHSELSANDQALSDSGYTPAKAKEMLLRRQRECLNGQ